MMNKKVLHVVNISFVLPYYIGSQFDHFSDKGIQFYVACQPSDHFYSYSEEKKFKPIGVNILREINVFEDLKAVYKLMAVIRTEHIDIVIGHTPKGGLIAMLAAFLSGITTRVYFRHGVMYETSKGMKRFMLKNIERFTGLLANKVVCVSPSVLKLSDNECLSAKHKNILLNKGTCNGIDALSKFNKAELNIDALNVLKEKYNIDKDDRVIGFVGRLVNDKGISELLNAWKELTTINSNIKLLLVGPLEERDGISIDLVTYIKTTPSIIYTGLQHDIAPYYGLMNIFILPSYREGFPTVVLEASAMELPILTTRVTGCRDSIVENETGIFIDLDPLDICRKLNLYLNNKVLAQNHGQNGRNFVLKNFEEHKIWAEIQTKVFNF